MKVPKPVTHTIPQFREFVRSKRCLITGKHGVDVCHVRTKRLAGDKENLVPLIHGEHMAQHALGIKSYQEARDIDLHAEAKRLWAEWVTTEEGRQWTTSH